MRLALALALGGVLVAQAWAQHEGHGGGPPIPAAPSPAAARQETLAYLQDKIDALDAKLADPGLAPRKRAKLQKKLERFLGEKSRLLDEARGPEPEPVRHARSQARRFMAYRESVTLTPEQQRLRTEVLSAIPALCGDLAKAAEGLTGHLIAQRGYDADRALAAVRNWLGSVDERWFGGRACVKADRTEAP